MDNQGFLTQRLRDVVKTTTFYTKYAGFGLLSEEQGNIALQKVLRGRHEFMAARGGATEMRCLSEHLAGKAHFSEQVRKDISLLSGVFSNDDASLHRFCDLYHHAMLQADFLAVWDVGAERKVAGEMLKAGHTRFLRLRSLEPYYFADPWSAALAGKRVLVVHPFAKSIRSQYERRGEIFPGKSVLPEFASLTVIPAVQGIAGEKPPFATWFDALEHMEREMLSTDFDVALIGAGAYGLPLAAYCRSIGKQAIQTSGATQILFGIKGRRWDDHPIISKLYNSAWVRPAESETPHSKSVVEGGSYW